MMQSKGAQAPLLEVMPLSEEAALFCVPALRDEAMLKAALTSFETGQMLEALLAVEYVCRVHPHQAMPALLRARIVAQCYPELLAKAWFQAYCCEPENPQFQDALLKAWLDTNALQEVRQLGLQLLPVRCQQGNHQSLLQLLRAAGVQRLGACWRNGDAIEGMAFLIEQPQAMLSVQLSDGQNSYTCLVPGNGQMFTLDCPNNAPVWTLSFLDAIAQDQPQALQGSPLAFAAAVVAQSGQIDFRLPPTLPDVSLVIPVYRGYSQVRACIESVLLSLEHNHTKVQVVVIDDASPEPNISAWLNQLAAEGKIVLLRNAVNLGYLESVNRVFNTLFSQAQTDVLLLNADTRVQGNWIDRMQAGLYSKPDIASVTPWSNNGEISSFPKIGWAAICPNEEQLAAIDQAASTITMAAVDIPSCCGFCMLMRGDVLRRVGGLDGFSLQRGYGEEVDWCLRATQLGWRHRLLPNVFVAHAGGVSFGHEKRLRVKQNKAVLVQRYPHYYQQYHDFLRADPLSKQRHQLLQELRAGHAEGYEWLQFAQQNLAAGTTSRHSVLPPALPSRVRRIAVWRIEMTDTAATLVLQLARQIAASGYALRLLVLGQVSESLWHTGVVDGMPFDSSNAIFNNLALIGLAGCELMLMPPGKRFHCPIAQQELNAEFDIQRCLDQLFVEQRPGSAGESARVRTQAMA